MLFFLGEFVGNGRSGLPARHCCAACSSAGEGDGLRAVSAAARVRVLRVRGDARIRCARRATADLTPITPGFFGYSGAAPLGARGLLPRAARRLPRHGHARSRACTRRPAPACSKRRSRVDEALAAADKAALFKTFTKVLAQQRGWMATFMAKWSKDWPGQCGHIHTLAAGDGDRQVGRSTTPASRIDERRDALVRRRPAGADAGAAGHGRLHGQFLHAADPRLLGADGLRPGASRTAPRRCASSPARPKSQRVEYRDRRRRHQSLRRAGRGLGSGLWGIENRIEPGEPS